MSRTSLLLLVVAGLTACLGGGEDDGEVASERLEMQAAAGRWTLPSETLAIGARTEIPYDDAPKWGQGGCAGHLKTGANELGTFLRDEFSAVDSVGGYACRKNTANAAKMSVHGTGRALDVFVPPTKGGAADNARGDKVANWLVEHAKEIGVQLVIWDRTIWQANGNNDRAYGGPNPHTDHLHVEVTDEAAAMKTTWFATLGLSPIRDAGSADGPRDPKPDAGTITPVPQPEPTPYEPPPYQPPPSYEPPPYQPPVVDPPRDAGVTAETPKREAPSVEAEDDDEPGERDSLTPTSTSGKDEDDRPAKRTKASPGVASSGCAASSPQAASGHAPLAATLGLVFAAFGLRRRRRA